MFLQWPLSPLSAHCLNSRSVLAACTISHEQYWVKSFGSMARPLIGQCCTDSGRWLVAGGWDIDGADIFADGWKWIIFHLGRSLSFYQVQLFEHQRIETASEILSSAPSSPWLLSENKKSPSVKIFKTVGQTFPSHRFIILANPPQLSLVSQFTHTSQFSDFYFIVSIS